ncbi:RNA polymerase sigma factor [Cucumibacter marinus]|uniref:RNA polymerase sigma factor n=1 Tax=Cucumibacter marinus TaxID=1121252 RepID=UPI00048AB2CB|nr:RNA polymerase sigma factor [Cucumibacter marinus]
MNTPSADRTIETVWRRESPKLIAALTRMMRDVDLAEDMAQEALIQAMRQWPRDGIPENPGAWLMTAAKRRALDYFRRNAMMARKLDELILDPDMPDHDDPRGDIETGLDDDIGDDVLRLVFTACHPVLPAPARAALALKMLAGLTTSEIARAFLTNEKAMAQRIVRAKRSITQARIPFEVPHGDERAARLDSVLEVVYLIFNEGFSATAGEDLIRPALCDEAIRLGRILAGLLPQEGEVLGLLALMQLQASRFAARTTPDGQPVLLQDQDRSLWDKDLIDAGLTDLKRTDHLEGPKGVYTLQAAIAACHASAESVAATNWPRIAALYHKLMDLSPSPVVALNHAVAASYAFGPETGLRLLDDLAAERALSEYPYLPAARGDMLERLGRFDEARAEFTRAAGFTTNQREKHVLERRAGGV